MGQKLQKLAEALRYAEIEFAGSIVSLCASPDEEMMAALERHRRQLADLGVEVEHAAKTLEAIDVTVADRMNNFLMTVQTVSDRLSATAAPEVREQLQQTVEHGRATVSTIRKALAAI